MERPILQDVFGVSAQEVCFYPFYISECMFCLDLMDILGFGEQGLAFQAKFARECKILLNANTVSNSSNNFPVNWENKK